jgi:hypothetical protein
VRIVEQLARLAGGAAITDPGRATPGEARALFRDGLRTPTAGWCTGRTQANLIAVPRDLAYDVLLFSQRNPKACPVLDVTEPGATATPLFDGDLRTDLPAYRVYVDGEAAGDVGDVRTEVAGRRRRVPDRLLVHLRGRAPRRRRADPPHRAASQRAHVPDERRLPRGRLHRRAPRRLHAARGAGARRHRRPRHRPLPRRPRRAGARRGSGRPRHHRPRPPDFGDPVDVRDGEVPVFWACGVTPQAAVMASRPPLAICHAPGHMAVTDARDTDIVTP